MFIFQRSILLLSLMIAANGLAQGVIDVHSHLEEKPSAAIATANMIVRIAEIEVYPKYLQEYLAFANEVDRLSIEREPGVICLYPMQSVEGTLHMVKDLKLPTMKPLDPETMKLIFKKQR